MRGPRKSPDAKPTSMCQRRLATYTVVDENAAPGGKSSVGGRAAVGPALDGPVEAQADISETDIRDAAARTQLPRRRTITRPWRSARRWAASL